MVKYDIIVIGAGAAGLMAAQKAAGMGARVLLLERNEKAGRKIAITGKGRCNVTNDSDETTIEENMVTNPRFVRSAVHRFQPHDTMRMIEELGVPLKVERGQRVFPVSDRSFDIIDALVKGCRKNHVTFRFSSHVREITKQEDAFEVRTDQETFRAARVILCTGGVSYPTTGSTGDGYPLAKSFGHSVTPINGGLVPLVTKENWARNLKGLSLRNVAVKVTSNGKTVFSDFGEMLFTHFGISGPVVLSASSRTGAWLRKKKTDWKNASVVFHIDLKPALDEEMMDERLRRDLEKYNKKQLIHAMEDLLPKRLIPVVIKEAGLSETLRADTLSAEAKRSLRNTLKDLKLTILGTRSVDEAIITQGGVEVREVDPKTMESKLVPGLYFAGELLDIDALTGGFNLQIAFSTGCAAGLSAAASLKEE